MLPLHVNAYISFKYFLFCVCKILVQMDNMHYEREHICTLRLEAWVHILVSYQMSKLTIVQSLLTLFVTLKVCYQVHVISRAVERMTYNERKMYPNGTHHKCSFCLSFRYVAPFLN